MVDSHSPRALTDRWRRLVDALNSDWLFRWPTFALYTAMGIPFVSISEYNRLATPTLLSALGVAGLSVGLTIGLIILAGPFIRPRTIGRIPLIVGSLVAIGIIRAAVVTAVIDGLGINRESFFTSRALLSAGAIPVLVIASTFIVATIAKGWRERAASRRAIESLRAERDEILADIARADDVLVTESEQTLRPQVDAIVATLQSSSRARVGDALDKLISTVVRPLSHSLAARARTQRASADSMSLPAARPVFPTADSFVGPLVAAAAVYLATVVTLFDVVPLINGVVTALIGASVTWAGLRIFQRLMAGLTLSVRLIVVIVVLAHLGMGLVVAWIDISLFRDYGVGIEITLALVTATLVPGLLYVAQRLVAHLGEVRLAEMTTARREMSLETSEVRRRAWLRQRHIAHALHSAIQSRVHAESQLVRSGAGEITSVEAMRITSTLNSMFDVLRDTGGATPDSVGELRRAIEFWSGMCTIDFSLDESVETMLHRDSDLAEAVLVTSLEIINNAIRHGKATRMTLSITSASRDLILIEATNNGIALADVEPGLGMSMFDELTVHWSLASNGATTFTGYIAAREPQAVPSSVPTNA
ncbi:MAG: hypothetical protein RLZZ587_934 [Actinomycetota bacterium]